MTADAYAEIIRAAPRDRLDLFLATANRLGTPNGRPCRSRNFRVSPDWPDGVVPLDQHGRS